MYHIKRFHENGEVLRQNAVTQKDGTELEYLTFPLLEHTGIIKHMVSTRLGGRSMGEFSTMNLSFTRGDNPDAVRENYGRIADILECKVNDMVASHQTHTTNIRKVTAQDKGTGILRQSFQDVDGLITNEPGIVLVTYFADCVPLFFVDVEHFAVGLAHSGRRGTVAGMGACMVRAMEQAYGSRPESLYAAIGPSICRDCYEVSEDVAQRFMDLFGEDVVFPGKRVGKYQLDLWNSNKKILLQAGILQEHITVTDICTCHNSEYLFSHRANGERRGNFGAFLMLAPGGGER